MNLKVRLTFISMFAVFVFTLVSEDKSQKSDPAAKQDSSADLKTVQKEGVPPFVSKSEFEIPDVMKNDLEDYRKKWFRLTNYEFSGLHWKQFIVIYMNKEPVKYVKNYMEYGRIYLDHDDEDEEDEEEAEEQGPPKFVKYSPGTIFLKEHFLSDNGKPSTAISVVTMKKMPKGYDPKNGDWEYAQFTPQGKMILKGKANDPLVKINCADCHKNMAERDFIFATYSIMELKKKAAK